MKRTPLLAGNWKMNGTLSEAVNLARDLFRQIGKPSGREVLVAPPFPVLTCVAAEILPAGYLLAGQNLHWEDSGAFTGEVSARMLVETGCSHVIIGHSERRQYFSETDASVAMKVGAALRANLIPIVCVGETLAERENGQTLGVIERQVRGALVNLTRSAFPSLVLAYEPVWAIGTGRVATPEQAQHVHEAIRRLVTALSDESSAAMCRILYGGSVKPDNVDDLMSQPDIDGALVGGASLKADDFARIVAFQS